MNTEQLHDLLGELHRELSDRPELDEQSREKLSQLMADIQAVLDRRGSPAGEAEQARSDEDEDEGLGERLEDAILHFEAAHPQISQFIGRLADGLSQMGI